MKIEVESRPHYIDIIAYHITITTYASERYLNNYYSTRTKNLFPRMYESMRKPAFLFDGRKMLDHEQLGKIGFHVETIGRRLNRR